MFPVALFSGPIERGASWHLSYFTEQQRLYSSLGNWYEFAWKGKKNTEERSSSCSLDHLDGLLLACRLTCKSAIMPEPDDGKATLDSGQLASGRVSGRETPQGSISLLHSPLSLLLLFFLLLIVFAITNWPNFAALASPTSEAAGVTSPSRL